MEASSLENSEVVLAQRLASGEPTIRKRVLKLLYGYIKENSSKEGRKALFICIYTFRNLNRFLDFNNESLSRLCKGLHYAMWMQDKPLLQEEMADNIAGLVDTFPKEGQSIEFAKRLLLTLSHEWPNIDRWRMDKFLMVLDESTIL